VPRGPPWHETRLGGVAAKIEIRKRAGRRLGELMDKLRKAGMLAAGTRGSRVKGARVDEKPTFAKQGIDKNLADRAREAMTEKQFEAAIARAIS
jgi:hypothetical protein